MKINSKHYSEFEVQAAAYYKLKQRFKNVKGEVKVANENSDNPDGGRGARLDIVILDNDDNIILIFELKRRAYAKNNSKQVQRYRRLFDCPVVEIHGWGDVKNIVNIALHHLQPIDYKIMRPQNSKWP